MGMLAAAAVMASIVAGAAMATRFAIRASHEREIADRRLVEQEQVLRGFLEGFYLDIRNLTGATPARKRMLDSSLRELERLRRERPGDRAVLATLALGYQEMGRLLGDTVEPSLSNPAAGKRLLQQAIGLYEELHRADPSQLSYLLGLSAVYRNVAKIEADTSRDPAAGFDAAGQALAWSRAALALAPQRQDAQDALCHALLTRFQLGISRDISRMHLEDVAEVRSIVAPLAAAQPEKPEHLTLLADSYIAEFHYYRMRLDYQSALPRIEKALDLYRQAGALLPNDTAVLRNLMNSYNGVGDLYPTGTLVSAERATDSYERAAEIAERLAMGDPADRNAQYQLALNTMRLAGLYQERKNTAKALQHAEHGVRIFRGLHREMEQNLLWRSGFVGSLLVYENICRTGGHPEAVEPILRETLAEALGGAEKNQRPENFLRSASLAAERLASWTSPRDADAALAFAEQSVQYAERARAIPGANPFTILRLGQARGEAALLYAQRRDETSHSRARALAGQSLAVMGELTEQQMAAWSKVTRESIRALTIP
jgi:tetratricopeptide (TPR) repeat protein